ncbi:hypothetical protein KNO15_19555 [Leifsonia shinshuensis]|uniref:hypothetical protein n=1 Tax=Leifsonia shinshuensis TaxID=150026 RepID=UPI001F50E72F|nr:hypothetical protein [Leifsonia shinshuensis]MCI0158904.1 hypothetical protein [Leifsonia shinshuensis]
MRRESGSTQRTTPRLRSSAARVVLWLCLLGGAAAFNAAVVSGSSAEGAFRIGLWAGSVAAVVLWMVPVVLGEWCAVTRTMAVRQLAPRSQLWDSTLDPATVASLASMGVEVSKRPWIRSWEKGLLVAVDEHTIRVFAGARTVISLLEIERSNVHSVSVVRVSNGWRNLPAVRITLTESAALHALYLSVRSRRWPGAARVKECTELCDQLASSSGFIRDRVVSSVGEGPAGGSRMIVPTGWSARDRFRSWYLSSVIIGALYVTGIVDRVAAFLTAHLPAVYGGIAASPLSLWLLGLVIVGYRALFGAALLSELSAGYTTLRWLVGIVPQVDHASGTVLRMPGDQPLSRAEENQAFARLRSRAR